MNEFSGKVFWVLLSSGVVSGALVVAERIDSGENANALLIAFAVIIVLNVLAGLGWLITRKQGRKSLTGQSIGDGNSGAVVQGNNNQININTAHAEAATKELASNILAEAFNEGKRLEQRILKQPHVHFEEAQAWVNDWWNDVQVTASAVLSAAQMTTLQHEVIYAFDIAYDIHPKPTLAKHKLLIDLNYGLKRLQIVMKQF